jgi:hypothetical protein
MKMGAFLLFDAQTGLTFTGTARRRCRPLAARCSMPLDRCDNFAAGVRLIVPSRPIRFGCSFCRSRCCPRIKLLISSEKNYRNSLILFAPGAARTERYQSYAVIGSFCFVAPLLLQIKTKLISSEGKLPQLLILLAYGALSAQLLATPRRPYVMTRGTQWNAERRGLKRNAWVMQDLPH